MFGKAMNRYYYGKSGQGDYSKDDLPTNRWQLFWEMLRIRFSGLFRLNLMYVVIWLPAIIIIGRGLLLGVNGLQLLGEMQMQLDAGEMALEAFNEQLVTVWSAMEGILLQTLLLLIPAIAITGPCTAGLCYVTRNWARDEHAFIWSDFKDAIIANWKQALITSVITGFVPAMMYLCNQFYGGMASQNVMFMVPQVLSMLVGVIWFLMLMYMYPMMVTYHLSYKDLLRNSALLSVARLPMNVVIRLAMCLPVIITLAVGYLLLQYLFIILLIFGMYYILLGFSLSRFIGASYTNAMFDKFINPRIEGAKVNQGLYNEEDDEDEEEADEAETAADASAQE